MKAKLGLGISIQTMSFILLGCAFTFIQASSSPSTLTQAFEASYPYPIEVDCTKDTAMYRTKNPIKDWTFITYMAADNDLAPFARRNLSQQAAIGSTDTINVLVHLDTKIPGNQKITKRFYVKKEKLLVMSNHAQKMDSGNPNSLINCCKWAIKNYPAKNYALILWDHGTGIIDISRPRTFNPSQLFTFNPANNLVELNRKIPFLEFLEYAEKEEKRGICFDDSTGHYITNQGLEHALKTITWDLLGGKKISILGFDACLMTMLEVANIVRDYVDIIVGSQEVELGTGWRYDLVLAPFLQQSMDPYIFAEHIVNAYGLTYSRITNDFTQSAISMNNIEDLENAMNDIGELLIQCLKDQASNSVYDALKTSRHKLLCTHFEEPSYLDLHHLLQNILTNLKRFNLKNSSLKDRAEKQLKIHIQKALQIIEESVFANVVGKNLNRSMGLSICFPERRLHPSYRKTKFAAHNKWALFINYYLSH